jgi:Zn-finger nucleic acid-binding protein
MACGGIESIVNADLWTSPRCGLYLCLKQVFNIDIKMCSKCGGAVKVIACIEDPVIIDKILSRLNEKAPPAQSPPSPKCRAPPPAILFDWG